MDTPNPAAPTPPTEPLSAILAEMRDLADHRAADAGGDRPAVELLRSYAARIEAAAAAELRSLRGHVRRLLDAVDALYTVAAPRDIARDLTPERTCLGVPIGRIVADARAMLAAQPQTPKP